MKKIVSILMSIIMLLSITAGLNFTAQAATLIWPVPGHIAGKDDTYHNGSAIDISDDSIAGATVVAAMGGTVTHVFKCAHQHQYSMDDGCGCNGFGTGIVISGSDGRIYQYAHLQSGSIPSNVYVGAKVSAGQQIGKVGTTGYSTGYHLHFGISLEQYWNQSGINPGNETYSYTSGLSAPTNLNVKTVNGKLNISWSSVSGASAYVVYAYTKANCSEYALKKQVSTNSLNDVSLTPGRYWIYVHAINGNNSSEGCGPFNYLSAPSNVKVTEKDGKFYVNWDSVPGANCYDTIVTCPDGETKYLHSTDNEKIFDNYGNGKYELNVQSLYRPNGDKTDQIVGAHSIPVTIYYEKPTEVIKEEETSTTETEKESITAATETEKETAAQKTQEETATATQETPKETDTSAPVTKEQATNASETKPQNAEKETATKERETNAAETKSQAPSNDPTPNAPAPSEEEPKTPSENESEDFTNGETSGEEEDTMEPSNTPESSTNWSAIVIIILAVIAIAAVAVVLIRKKLPKKSEEQDSE